MDIDRFPSVTQVRQSPPGELAVLLSTMTADAVSGLGVDAAEAVVVATQRVSSWAVAMQAVAVDRFAEHVLDAQEHHAADLMSARDAQRAEVEAAGGVWHGDRGAVALPEPEQVAASMLAPELRISPRTMRTRLNRARWLMELPTTLGLALAGDLEPWRVDAVVAAAADVDAKHLVEFEARLFAGDVGALPKPRLVERARSAAARADAESVARGQARAPKRRCLRVGASQVAGVMRWTADLPDEVSRRMFAAIDALAQEYLAADRASGAERAGVAAAGGADHAGADPAGSVRGTSDGSVAPGAPRQRRTVEQVWVDALADLVLGNATVQTVVELVVPVASTVPPSFVERVGERTAAEAAMRPQGGDEPPQGGDAVVIDLVLGSVTRHTLDAGALERAHGRSVGAWLETEANPFLSHRPPPRPPTDPDPQPGAEPGPPIAANPTATTGAVPAPPPRVTDLTGAPVWFVPGLIQTPGAGALLPDRVAALLNDPDTGVRIIDGTPGSADGRLPQWRTYRPHAALAAKVRARDGHCRFPGCSVQARRCHLDHVVAFPAGQTEEANLQALCPAHHGFKHHAGWGVTMTPDGVCTWTTPSGRTHITRPPDMRDTAA